MQWWVGGRRGFTISLVICLTCVGRSRFRVFMHAFVKDRWVQKAADGQPGLRAMVTVICYMASQGQKRDSCDRAGGAIEVVAGARASRRRNANRAKISNSHPRSILTKVQKSHHKWFWAPIPPHPLPVPRASGGLSLSLSLSPLLRLGGVPPIVAASFWFRYGLLAFVVQLVGVPRVL